MPDPRPLPDSLPNPGREHRSGPVGWYTVVKIAMILGAGWFAFSPALHGGWLWDDPLDISNNPLVREPAGLWKIWFHPAGLYDYYPIKFSVQWLQWRLWQNDTYGYHVTNVALHLISALLFWRILRRLGVAHAWLGGLLFVVHPLTVESVAWITELKNTLSLPLFLASFDRYLSYDERRRRTDYAAALALFVAAMLCKTSVATAPLVLLLHAWWKRRHIVASDVKATAPFFAVSAVLGIVTWWFQQHIAIVESHFDPVGGIAPRIACAGTAAAFYLWKTVVPFNLMPIYPQWALTPLSLTLVAPWIVIVGLLVWFWSRRATWGRHALFGAGWFLLFAAPILGFVTISSQRFTWVMDHLAYVPLLGLIGMITAAAGLGLNRISAPLRPWLLSLAVAVCGALAVASHGYAAIFQSQETLWTYAVARNPAAWLGYLNLGKVCQESNRNAAAIEDYRTALRIHPNYPDAYYNLGNALRAAGKIPDAIAAYRQAVQLNPQLAVAHGNLGVLLAQTGQVAEAIAECERALALDPNYTEAHYNLGSILIATGRSKDAIPHLTGALRLDPKYPGAENNLAIALSSRGQNEDAIVHFRRALAATPRAADVHNNLGNSLRQSGRLADAIAEFQEAIRLRPDYVNAHFNLGVAYAAAGRLPDAAASFRRVVELKPDYVDARVNLAAVLQATGDRQEAQRAYDQARRLRPTLPPMTF